MSISEVKHAYKSGAIDKEARGRIAEIRELAERGEIHDVDELAKVRKLLAEYDRLTVDERELVDMRDKLIERTKTLRMCGNLERVRGEHSDWTHDIPEIVGETLRLMQWKELSMSEIIVYPNGDGALAGVIRKVGVTGPIRDGAGRIDPRIVHVGNDAVIHMCGLQHGMHSGLPSIAMAFELPDKRLAFIEISLRSFLDAADGLKAAHGDPRKYSGETVASMDLDIPSFAEAGSPTAKMARHEIEFALGPDAVARALAAVDTPSAVRSTAGQAAKAFRALRERPEATDAERRELDKLIAQMEAEPADRIVRFEGDPAMAGTAVDSVVRKIVANSPDVDSLARKLANSDA